MPKFPNPNPPMTPESGSGGFLGRAGPEIEALGMGTAGMGLFGEDFFWDLGDTQSPPTDPGGVGFGAGTELCFGESFGIWGHVEPSC